MDWKERSPAERDTCNLNASIRIDGRALIPCSVVNLSMEGAGLLLSNETPDLPERFCLSLPIFDELFEERAVELRWRLDKRAGVRFIWPSAP